MLQLEKAHAKQQRLNAAKKRRKWYALLKKIRERKGKITKGYRQEFRVIDFRECVTET